MPEAAAPEDEGGEALEADTTAVAGGDDAEGAAPPAAMVSEDAAGDDAPALAFSAALPAPGDAPPSSRDFGDGVAAALDAARGRPPATMLPAEEGKDSIDTGIGERIGASPTRGKLGRAADDEERTVGSFADNEEGEVAPASFVSLVPNALPVVVATAAAAAAAAASTALAGSISGGADAE